MNYKKVSINKILNYFYKHYLKFTSGYHYNTRIYNNFRPLIQPMCATETGKNIVLILVLDNT